MYGRRVEALAGAVKLQSMGGPPLVALRLTLAEYPVRYSGARIWRLTSVWPVCAVRVASHLWTVDINHHK
jgi:hypothetical protein